MITLTRFFIAAINIVLLGLLSGCLHDSSKQKMRSVKEAESSKVTLIILGVMQDGGRPHMGCKKSCCWDKDTGLKSRDGVVSLGIYDREFDERYLFEATPDLAEQWSTLITQFPAESNAALDGIFLTHAHIGHYMGLALLGKEVMSANNLPVYAMPKLRYFLNKNGPWNQLIHQNNIELESLEDRKPLSLNRNIQVIPFLVPHRDEYSETVGFRIIGPNKSALFIPDIDKWGRWDQTIVDLIKTVDYAFLDATFFDGNELTDRDMGQVPHPFVVESMLLFDELTETEKAKINFIHFNHTNPIADPNSEATKRVLDAGFKIASKGELFSM